MNSATKKFRGFIRLPGCWLNGLMLLSCLVYGMIVGIEGLSSCRGGAYMCFRGLFKFRAGG